VRLLSAIRKGTPIGDDFQVNSHTSTDVWSSIDIWARRFATPIFTGGFESCDTSAWSSTQ